MVRTTSGRPIADDAGTTWDLGWATLASASSLNIFGPGVVTLPRGFIRYARQNARHLLAQRPRAR
jgi:hypothetical protein